MKYDMWSVYMGRILNEVNYTYTYGVQYMIDFLGPTFMHSLESMLASKNRNALLALEGTDPIVKANKADRIISSGISDAIASLGIISYGNYIPKGLVGNMLMTSMKQRGEVAQYGRPPGIIGKVFEDRVTDFYFAGLVTIPSEISNRHRYAVGIRNIELDNREYAEYAQIISKRFVSPVPVGGVALKTEEVIPGAFRDAEATAAQIAEAGFEFTRPWITYEISLDGGVTWHPISPLNGKRWFIKSTDGKKRFQVPTLIRVNSDIPDERRMTEIWGPLGYIDTAEGVDPRFLMLKTTLQRPSDDLGTFYSGLTPRLDSYELLVNPGSAGGNP
jgi:hypothetical protein